MSEDSFCKWAKIMKTQRWSKSINLLQIADKIQEAQGAYQKFPNEASFFGMNG